MEYSIRDSLICFSKFVFFEILFYFILFLFLWVGVENFNTFENNIISVLKLPRYYSM